MNMEAQYQDLLDRCASVCPVYVKNSGRQLLVAQLIVIDNGDKPSDHYVVEMNTLREVSAIKQLPKW